MSEEKPTFKVTDRRLFNADGTPRDIEREEEPPAPAPSAAPPASQTAETAPTPVADAAPQQPSGATAQATARAEESAAAQSPNESDDPQDFLMVVEFIASFAAEALGMSAHPESGGQAHINPPLARQCIDMLGALERKTRGNLNAEEQQFLDLILTQLRMQYVQITRSRPAGGSPSRGFTGSDITGGR